MNAPIQPTLPVNPTITIQPVVAAVSNQASQTPQNPLLTLPSGTLVEGFVINRDAQNNPIVRTTLGDLKVTSEIFLKTGSEIVFKVDTTQASLARIISVDGLTPEAYQATQSNARAPLGRDTVSTTSLQLPHAPMAGGKPAPTAPSGPPLLQAIVLQSHPLASASQAAHSGPIAQMAGLRSGTTLKLTLLDLKLPPLPIALSALPPSTKIDALISPPPTPTSASTTSPVISATASPATGTSSPTQHPQDELSLLQLKLQQQEMVREAALIARQTSEPRADERIATYGKTSTPVNTPSPPPPPDLHREIPPPPPAGEKTILTAQVIGHDAEGANILHTPVASLKLYTSQPLPTGTTLVVQTDTEHVAQATVTASTEHPETAAPLPGEPRAPASAAIEETLNWLSANQPELLREVAQRLPAPNARLTSSMLFFLAAMKGGDLSALLGKRVERQLEALAPDLLQRLKRALAASQELLNTPTGTSWITYQIPIFPPGQMPPVTLYVPQDPPQERNSSTQSKGQRFVLEVNLSELGTLQFDGFVRTLERTKGFDLIVRSDQALTPEISQNIRQIFENALAVTGLMGQIIFQIGSQNFFRPTPPSASSSHMQTILA